jgi:hypothetical protein
MAKNLANEIDKEYPGTAVARMQESMARCRELTPEQLSSDWETVRQNILWAGGLRDLPDAKPGQGYTGHSFNDFNHCDCATMLLDQADNNNAGKVAGIAYNNPLGNGIRVASLPELGPGGSWSTCTNGCHTDPPQDVAHVQFQCRIAFKLVWCPPDFKTFVLVDDDGNLLNQGTPKGNIPGLGQRQANFKLVGTGKYSKVALQLSPLAGS